MNSSQAGRSWLFQCNPKKFRIFDAVASSGPINNWAANQHKDEMTVGDRAALWISAGDPSYPSGVYALGTIRSLAYAGRVDGRYWIGEMPEPTTFVDIKFNRNVFHYPVSRDLLLTDPDFVNARLIRMPRETSSPLWSPEWRAVERRVQRRSPTKIPTLSRRLP